MKVRPLTRIFSLAPEICPNVLLTRETSDVFYAERVFLYCHGQYGLQHPLGILRGL